MQTSSTNTAPGGHQPEVVSCNAVLYDWTCPGTDVNKAWIGMGDSESLGGVEMQLQRGQGNRTAVRKHLIPLALDCLLKLDVPAIARARRSDKRAE